MGTSSNDLLMQTGMSRPFMINSDQINNQALIKVQNVYVSVYHDIHNLSDKGSLG